MWTLYVVLSSICIFIYVQGLFCFCSTARVFKSWLKKLYQDLFFIFAFKLVKSVHTVCCPIQTQEVHERISLVVIAECEWGILEEENKCPVQHRLLIWTQRNRSWCQEKRTNKQLHLKEKLNRAEQTCIINFKRLHRKQLASEVTIGDLILSDSIPSCPH